MNNEHDSAEQSDSLLRRLLNEDQEPRIPAEGPMHRAEDDTPPGARYSPVPGHNVPAHPQAMDDDAADLPPVSPIRPTVPDSEHDPHAPLTPTPPRTPLERQLSPREQMQRAEEALINLRHKMALVAAEFAEGKLNQAQFDAIYARYSEQRDITERLLTRDPESQAWQSVVRPGHTQFLKQYYEARPLSYTIYDLGTFGRIIVTGKIQIREQQVRAVLERLKTVMARRGNPGAAQKKLPDGKCVLFVPGTLTAVVMIFSLEPATGQIERVSDMHRDFERANRRALQSGDYNPHRMVFPHRALFETSLF
ncbi:MAG: hypothetical protein K8S97_03495 [Anaerolineae bacterium]|nr:hypothetical protein [Anaerolineae bacterium]